MNVSNSMSSVMMSQVQGNQQSIQQRSLSEEQKSQVEEILSNYDSENFSQSDFEDIFQQFKESGIPLGDSLKSVNEAAGFDFESNIQEAVENGTMPPKGNMPPPPPPQNNQAQSNDDSTEYSSQLAELLAEYEAGEADQSDFETLIESIRASSTTTTGNILNRVA